MAIDRRSIDRDIDPRPLPSNSSSAGSFSSRRAALSFPFDFVPTGRRPPRFRLPFPLPVSRLDTRPEDRKRSRTGEGLVEEGKKEKYRYIRTHMNTDACTRTHSYTREAGGEEEEEDDDDEETEDFLGARGDTAKLTTMLMMLMRTVKRVEMRNKKENKHTNILLYPYVRKRRRGTCVIRK